MALVEDFPALFSLGQYKQCASRCIKQESKGDNLYSQWLNTCNLISSQFMSVVLEDDIRTDKKTQQFIEELQKTIKHIRSAPVDSRLLQIELSALYNLLFIKTFNQDNSFNHDGSILQLIKETLVRVIGQQSWTSCHIHENVEDLLVKSLHQTHEDSILSSLVNLACLWSVVKCRTETSEEVIPLMEKCIRLENLKDMELPPLVLLPLHLQLTGQHYIDDKPSLSDIVYFTAGVVFYRIDKEKATDCLKKVSLLQFKPYTLFLIASLDHYNSKHIQVLTTLSGIEESTNFTVRVQALHCFLFGLALSKLEKHQCAIQKYRDALDHDFSFLQPLYHIAIAYRQLVMTAAELESLNLLATAIENSKDPETDHSRQNLFTMLIEDLCGQLTQCQVLYSLASRCTQLKMYDDASQRYLNLLEYLHNSSIIQILGNVIVKVPRIETIYMEAICCLHKAKKYTDCLDVCDQILSCLPSQSQNASLNFPNQPDIELLSCDQSINDISVVEIPELKSSQDGSKRKRQQSEESVKFGGSENDLQIQLYRADCFVMSGKIEDAVKCLDRCCDRLPYCTETVKGLKSNQQAKRRRVDSAGDSASQTDIENVSDLQKLASSVYCHVGVAAVTKGQDREAIHFLRISLRINPGNLEALFNYVVVLWFSNKKEAATQWCQGRDIETALDSFHLSNLLKQKQNKLRSMTGKDFFQERELIPSNTITDEAVLKLDVICLNFLLTAKNNK